MADFCKQCSESIFGKDYHDLAGISRPQDTSVGLYAYVLCEECGYIKVDHEGRCMAIDCLHKHGVVNGGVVENESSKDSVKA